MRKDLNYVLTDDDLHLKASQLFNKYSIQMQVAFDWQEKTRESYKKRIQALEDCAPSSEPFCLMIYSDYSEQIREMNEEKQYKSSTLVGLRSIIADLCAFAECYSNGRYSNPLWGTNVTKTSGRLPEKDRIDRIVRNRLKLARSLKPIEELRLVRLIDQNVETDSRYLAVAILFYLGLRPGECCALTFGDIRPLSGYPQVHCLYIHRQRDANQSVRTKLKTANAYRILPIPEELWNFILRRKKVVAAGKKDISRMPLICDSTRDWVSCNRREVTSLCSRLLREIKIRKAVLQNSAEEIRYGHATDEEEPTTYLLRRNFATALSGVCGADEDELQYLLGHRIEALDEKRHDFLMPDLQLAMWKKLNLRRVFSLIGTTGADDCLKMGRKSITLQQRTSFQFEFDEIVKYPQTFCLFNEYPNDFIKVQFTPLSEAAQAEPSFQAHPFFEPMEDALMNPKRVDISSEYNASIRTTLSRSDAKTNVGKKNNGGK